MMLPILISVSVAPVSYFFCASAPPDDAASNPNAAERTASLLIVDIPSLPFSCNWQIVPGLLKRALLTAPCLPSCREPDNKKPPRQGRRGCFFSSHWPSSGTLSSVL